VGEHEDIDVDSDLDEFELIGFPVNSQYKQLIKRAHTIYKERRIGAKAQSEFILSNHKLQKLIEDVKFIKKHYKVIKSLSRK
jgi:hypothetical protein